MIFTKSIYNISLLTKEEILLNYKFVREAFKWVVNLFKERKRKIKYIILAEAPISYSSYFYNPVNESDKGCFLTKQNVSTALNNKPITNKYELTLELVDHNILIVDIFPLPLPTKFYSNKELFYDMKELDSYWVEVLKDIQPLIEKFTKITHRYNRLLNNPDAKKFVDLFDTKFGTNNKQQQSIASKDRCIAQKEFNKLFK